MKTEWRLTRRCTISSRCPSLLERPSQSAPDTPISPLTQRRLLTRNRVGVSAEHAQTLRRYRPDHHTLRTHRVMEHLSRVREEDRAASDEEHPVVQPHEDNGTDTWAGVTGLLVDGRADGETDVGEEDTGPGDEDLRATADVLGEVKTEHGHEGGELEGDDV